MPRSRRTTARAREAYTVANGFIDRYEQAYGEAPGIFAGHAYDALYLVVEAAKRVEGDLTPEALRDADRGHDRLVGIGGTFTFTAADHNGLTEDDLHDVRDLRGQVARRPQ